MHYQQGGGKYPIHVPGGVVHQGKKIGRDAFVQGELAFMGALFRLNFS
jgi:hypothetical protein